MKHIIEVVNQRVAYISVYAPDLHTAKQIAEELYKEGKVAWMDESVDLIVDGKFGSHSLLRGDK